MNPIKILLTFICILVLSSIWFLKEANISLIKGSNTSKVGSLIFDAPATTDLSSPFNINLTIDTKGQPVNAVALHLIYDSEKVEITNVDTSNSFCEFYPENKFDNEQGLLKIACGAPHPGVTGKNTIAQVSLIAKTIGNAEFALLEDSLILLSDGKGTNILNNYPHHEILIINSI